MDRKRFTIEVPWPNFSEVRLAHLLPTPGNMIFTLAMIALLVAAQTVGALPLGRPQAAPSATSTSTLAYQGRLADSAGAPLTGTYNMSFRLYNEGMGGTPLWVEQWTGPNGVKVRDGLFNVMLGSLTALPQAVITGHDQLFLGITVGTDDEMLPRVQLGSVPFAVQALSVPDGSVTTAKIADGAVTQAKLTSDLTLPMVPKVLAYVNKDGVLLLNCAPDQTPRVIETINFVLPPILSGYKWNLEWRFNQRIGMTYGWTTWIRFLIDGMPITDSTGTPFSENLALLFQDSANNMEFGGTVYQNSIAPGSHTLTWQVMGQCNAGDQFLVRQRWLVLTAILVPESF